MWAALATLLLWPSSQQTSSTPLCAGEAADKDLLTCCRPVLNVFKTVDQLFLKCWQADAARPGMEGVGTEWGGGCVCAFLCVPLMVCMSLRGASAVKGLFEGPSQLGCG